MSPAGEIYRTDDHVGWLKKHARKVGIPSNTMYLGRSDVYNLAYDNGWHRVTHIPAERSLVSVSNKTPPNSSQLSSLKDLALKVGADTLTYDNDGRISKVLWSNVDRMSRRYAAQPSVGVVYENEAFHDKHILNLIKSIAPSFQDDEGHTPDMSEQFSRTSPRRYSRVSGEEVLPFIDAIRKGGHDISSSGNPAMFADFLEERGMPVVASVIREHLNHPKIPGVQNNAYFSHKDTSNFLKPGDWQVHSFRSVSVAPNGENMRFLEIHHMPFDQSTGGKIVGWDVHVTPRHAHELIDGLLHEGVLPSDSIDRNNHNLYEKYQSGGYAPERMRRGGEKRRYSGTMFDPDESRRLLDHIQSQEQDRDWGPFLQWADWTEEHGYPTVAGLMRMVPDQSVGKYYDRPNGQRWYAENFSNKGWVFRHRAESPDHTHITISHHTSDEPTRLVWHVNFPKGIGAAASAQALRNEGVPEIDDDGHLITRTETGIPRRMFRPGSPRRYAVSGYEREEAEFHRAIREHPEDPGPSLVYADWLEERGKPHMAQLIRMHQDPALRVHPRVKPVYQSPWTHHWSIPEGVEVKVGHSRQYGYHQSPVTDTGRDNVYLAIRGKDDPTAVVEWGAQLPRREAEELHNNLSREAGQKEIFQQEDTASQARMSEPQQMSRYSSPRRYAAGEIYRPKVSYGHL